MGRALNLSQFQHNVTDGTTTVATTYVTNGSAKAWINFNGQGTIAARDSMNVASLTDNATGNYTINFSNSMGNGNYSLTGATGNNSTLSSGASAVQIEMKPFSSQTTSGVGIYTVKQYDPYTVTDLPQVNASIFGDLA